MLKDFWDEQAEAWGRFTRTPGHDVYHEQLNFPAFLELVPPAGRRTLDLGCGEGRIGAALLERGHRVVGVDASPAMVALARERHEAVVADATDLPFEDGSFDLVVAYMSVMNFDDPEAALAEAGRVLEPGGRICVAMTHPMGLAGRFAGEEPDAPYVIDGSYFEPTEKRCTSDREGISVTFLDRLLPLERISRALEGAGLAIEAIREPRPPEAFLREHPNAARRLRLPLFLHFLGLRT